MPSSPSSSSTGLRHRAWVIAAITFVVLLLAAAVRSFAGVLIVPFENEFGWSRPVISLAVSVNLLLYGLIGPFAAGLINRHGPRRMMLAAIAMVACGVVSTIQMKHSWELVLLWGVLVGGGTGMTALVLGTTVVHRWFHHHRGLVIGVFSAASATGQMVFLPAFTKMVVTDGWRSAVWVVVIALLVVLPLIAFFMRDDPAQVGLKPYGMPEDQIPTRLAVSAHPFRDVLQGLREGVRSRDFWILAGSFFVCGASTNGLIGTHFIPTCMDYGLTEMRAAGLLATMGIFDLVGTIASGWLSDRFSNRWLLFTYYGLRGVSLLFLPAAFAPGTDRLTWFAVFYGLDWIATVPPTVALTAQIFGREKVGIMFGWIFAAHQVGAACAAWGAGWIRSISGFYDHAFMISGSLCVVTALLVLQTGRSKAASTSLQPDERDASAPA